KTCWVSIYDMTNSIVCVRLAIDKIFEDKSNIFTNQELIKRVINLLESCMASLADCFIGIVQIATALKKIPASNNFCTLAIAGLKKGKFLEICELAAKYYKEVNHNDKDYCRLMSQLIKYKARSGPWKLEYSSNLTPLYTSSSIIRKHGTTSLLLYIKKELKFCDDFIEIELHNNLAVNNITMALQDLVDLSDPIFGANNNQEEPILTD
ncbi:39776_t:CDS:2, partial [Gigaspora margarita]